MAKRVTLTNGRKATVSDPIDARGSVRVTTADGTRIYSAGQAKHFIAKGG